MEGRGEERVVMQNSISYNHPPPPMIQESPVKLPLAPILSTPPERRANAMAASTRRGTSIFSPIQTLDHRPPAPQNPDPPPAVTPTAAGASNSNNPAPAVVPPQPQPPSHEATGGGGGATRYRECLKNHAASMGGHVVDGCGEFMPRGEDGTPEALRCAACDCHRNFHRREADGEQLQPHRHRTAYNPISSNPNLRGQVPPHLKHSRSNHSQGFATGPTPPMMVSFGGNSGGGGAAAESSSEDLNNMFHSGEHTAGPRGSYSGSKKRFRTKFSQEQKGRMHEFASKLGWRIQKQDEQEVQQFCSQVGVKRQVFKVWMHNNKQAIKRRQPDDQ